MNFYNGVVENLNRGDGDLFTVRNNAKLNVYGGRILNVDGKDDIQIVSPGVVTRHDGYDALPRTLAGASVRLVEGSEGIRFESQIPAALVNIREANYDLALSAVSYIRYIRDGHEVTVCSSYTEADNSRSMAEVAQMALEDVKDAADDEYRYLDENGKYSPYTDAQRKALKVYLGLDA